MNATKATKIALSIRLAGGALACLLAGAPAAAAEQARAVLSVTATVLPACTVALEQRQQLRADIACSTGASVSTMTAARHDERPLGEAEALLGAPVRRAGTVVFTAQAAAPPASGASAESGESAAPGARYLTVTY